ncbi:hypothetical protein F5Y03DRAFT_400871 [Xylaria venustula]|nr:hypothetical protein F5Y03DRAFT_400871 [Xylaria venustula]
MANVVEHVLRSRYLQGQEERIGGVDDAQSLRVAQTNYEYLIDNLNRLTDEKTTRAIQTRQEALYNGEGSREITVEHINCPMGAEKKQEWKQDGQRGPEPTQRSIEAGLFGSGEDNNVAARMNQRSRKAWMRLTRTGVYPFLAHLLDMGVIEDGDLHHEAVNQLGVMACKAYFTEGWDEMVSAFEKSSLWSHRKELSQQSPRFDRLCQFVDEMLSYRSQAPTANDPGPRDGTNIRHMIVLAQSPLSAFITYMLLAHAYRGNVKVVLLNAATKIHAHLTPLIAYSTDSELQLWFCLESEAVSASEVWMEVFDREKLGLL